MAAPTLISFLSDFGTRDPWVAICKGVLLGIAPDARILDITHKVPAYDVIGGALTLAAVLPELPAGVVLAVVDPGVGTERRGVGIRTLRGDVLVGPDNGLLLPAARALGGVVAAHELTNAQYRRPTRARTFHGRDVFAPAAAHLALGVDLAAFGARVPADDLVDVALPGAERLDGVLQSGVLAIDAFGNVDLAGTRADLEIVLGGVRGGDELLVQWWIAGGASREAVVPWAVTFGDVGPGEALLYDNALGRLSLAVREGSAADTFAMDLDTIVNVRRPT
jgi:S-adenosylmethionine hydrolase